MILLEPGSEPLRAHAEGLPVPWELRTEVHADEFVRGKDLLLLANGGSLYPGAFLAQIESVRIDPANGFEGNERNAFVPHLLDGAESGDMPAGFFGNRAFDRFHDRR